MTSNSKYKLIIQYNTPPVTPLDVIKTRLQTQQKKLLSDRCFVYCNGLMDHLCPCYPVATNNGSAVLPNTLATSSLRMGGPTIHHHPRNNPLAAPAGQPYTGTIDALLKISRHEGAKTLWSGLGPTLVLAIPATVIYFVFYEQLRVRMKDQYFRQFPGESVGPKGKEVYPETTTTNCVPFSFTDHSKDHPPFFIPLLAGMAARITSVTVVNPMELVRTKMQSQRMSYFEVRNALHSVVQHEGYRGLWRGLGSTLCRDVPFSGIYWTTYEALKRQADVESTPGFWFSFAAGAASGCVSISVQIQMQCRSNAEPSMDSWPPCSRRPSTSSRRTVRSSSASAFSIRTRRCACSRRATPSKRCGTSIV